MRGSNIFTTLQGSSATAKAWSLNAKKHRFGCPYTRQLESAAGIGIKLDRKPSKTENNQGHPSTLSHQPLCLAAQLLQKRRLQKPVGQPIAEDIPNQHLFPYFHSHQPNSPKKFGCKQFGLLPISSYLDAPGGSLRHAPKSP